MSNYLFDRRVFNIVITFIEVSFIEVSFEILEQ